MLQQIKYDRTSAVEYAKKWAFKRNPRYFDFEDLGGDCTNFVSQCIYSGCRVMNYTKTYGWYYLSINNRAPAWTGSKYLYDFLIKNKEAGPIAIVSNAYSIEPGDVIQLGNENNDYYHSLIVVNIEKSQIFVASHSVDSYMRLLDTYNFKNIRFLHIIGANKPKSNRK